jgi:hypothetical protein
MALQVVMMSHNHFMEMFNFTGVPRDTKGYVDVIYGTGACDFV